MTFDPDPQIPNPAVNQSAERAIAMSKMFGWMAAMLLSASVFISLLVVTQDRNDLRNQLDAQDRVVACRSLADTEVDRLMAERQILLGEESLAVSEVVLALIASDPENPTDLKPLSDKVVEANNDLVDSRVALQAALDAQEASITSCRISD